MRRPFDADPDEFRLAAEAEEAARAVRLLGGSGLKRVEYELPEGYGQRTLLFCEKSRPTPAAYPRGNGRERRTPL